MTRRDSIFVNGQWVHVAEIYVMNWDGSQLVRLTYSNPNHTNGCASWSPDGQRLAFGRWGSVTTTFNIFVINSDGSGLVRLTEDFRDSSYPQWSPAGSAILFLTNRGETTWSKLYLMNPDGTDQRPFGDMCPSANVLNMLWSPDGTQIAFDCSTGYGTEVYVVRADGADRRRISSPTGPSRWGYDQSPVWSPDAKSLAIGRNSDGNLDVYRVDVTTGAATRLTADPGLEWPSDWRIAR